MDRNDESAPVTEEDCLKENLLILEYALKGTLQSEYNENTHKQVLKDIPMEHESETNITEKIKERYENMDNNIAVDEKVAIDKKNIYEIQATGEMEAGNNEIVDESQGIDQETVQKSLVIEQNIVHESQAKTKIEVETIHDENTNTFEIVDMKINSPSSNQDVIVSLNTSESNSPSQNVIEMNIPDHTIDYNQTMDPIKYDVDENDHAETISETETLVDNINIDASIEPMQAIPENNQEAPVPLESEVVNNDPEGANQNANVTQTSMESEVSTDRKLPAKYKIIIKKDPDNVILKATNIEPVLSVHESNQATAVSLEPELINNVKTEPFQNSQQAMEFEESTVDNVQKDTASIVWECPFASAKLGTDSSKVINSKPAKTSSVNKNIEKAPNVWGNQNVPDTNIKTIVATPKWDLLSKSIAINDNKHENVPLQPTVARKGETRWGIPSTLKIEHTVNQNIHQNISGTAKTAQQNVRETSQTTDAAKLFWQTNAKVNQPPVTGQINSLVSTPPAVTWEANPDKSSTPNASVTASNRDSQSPSSIHEEVNIDIEPENSDNCDMENEHYDPIPQTEVYSGYNSMYCSPYVINKGVLLIYDLPNNDKWPPSRVKSLIAKASRNDMVVINNIAHIFIEKTDKLLKNALVKFRNLGCAGKALDYLRLAIQSKLLQSTEELNSIGVKFDKEKFVEWDDNEFPIFRAAHRLANRKLPFGNKHLSGASPQNGLPGKPAAVSAAHDQLAPAFMRSRCLPFAAWGSLDPTDKRRFGLSREFLASLQIKQYPLTSTVVVHNLEIMQDNQIRNIFCMAGTIHAVHMYVNTNNTSARIRYDHPLEAVQAISMFNYQKINGRLVHLTMLPTKATRKVKFQFPLGVAKVGPGLGPDGTVIEGVRTTIELALLKNMCEKEIAALYETVEEMKKILEEKTKELNTRVLARVMSNSMQNPLVALGLMGVQQGLMHQITGQDPEVMNSAQVNTVQNQMVKNPVQNYMEQITVLNQRAQNTVQNQRPQNMVLNQTRQNPEQNKVTQYTIQNQRVKNPEPNWSTPTAPIWSQPQPRFTPNTQPNPQLGPSQPVPNSQPGGAPETLITFQQNPEFMNQVGLVMANPFLPGQIMPGSFVPAQVMPGFVPEQNPAVQPIQYPQSIRQPQPVLHLQPQHPQLIPHPQPISHPQPRQPQPVPHSQPQHQQSVQPIPHSQPIQPIQIPQSRFDLVEVPIAHPVPSSQPQNIPLPTPKIDPPLPSVPKTKIGQFLRDIPVAVAKPKVDLDSIPIPFNKSPSLNDVRARVTKKIAALKLPPPKLTNPPKAKPVALKPIPVLSRDVRPKAKRSRSRSKSCSSSDSDRPKKYRKSPERSFKRAPEKDSRSNKERDGSTFLQFKFLPPSVTTQDLREKMGELGRVTSVVMLGKGQALVGFRYKCVADTCIEMYDRSKVDDQYISVTLHVPESKH